jgi:hypothetical protein
MEDRMTNKEAFAAAERQAAQLAVIAAARALLDAVGEEVKIQPLTPVTYSAAMRLATALRELDKQT